MLKKLLITISLISAIWAADFFEDALEWDWVSSGLTVAAIAYGKEALDESQVPGSFNWKDAEWTIYGWLFKRFLTFRFEF